jgi:hypothetical protein
MNRPRRNGFTVWTGANASGSYRGWEHAVSSARWLASSTNDDVQLISDDSGASWDVSPDGRVTADAARWRTRTP